MVHFSYFQTSKYIEPLPDRPSRHVRQMGKRSHFRMRRKSCVRQHLQASSVAMVPPKRTRFLFGLFIFNILFLSFPLILKFI